MIGNLFIDFEKIQDSYPTKNMGLFDTYLKDVFNDLSQYSSSNNSERNCDKHTFIDFINLPYFIAEKLFKALDLDDNGLLFLDEFANGMRTLFTGCLEEQEELIFRLLDFDRDGYIVQRDIVIICVFISTQINKDKDYIIDLRSLITEFFDGRSQLAIEQFKDFIETKNSDVFFLIYCFIYDRKPFNNSSLKVYNMDKDRLSRSINSLKGSPSNNNSPRFSKKILASPTLRVRRLTDCFKMMNSLIFDNNSNLDFDLTDTADDDIDEGISTIRVPAIDDVKNLANLYQNGCKSEIKTSLLSPSKDTTANNSSQSVSNHSYQIMIGKCVKKEKTSFGVDNFCDEDKLAIDIKSLLSSHKKSSSITMSPMKGHKAESEEEITSNFEGYLFKKNKNNKIKKFWLVLISKDLFYFKSSDRKLMKGLHNLSHCYVVKGDKELINNESYYSFYLKFRSKTRQYYAKSEESMNSWIAELNKSLNFNDVNDHYNFLEDLGKGSFGVVKQAEDLKTKEKVAIKIIKKARLSLKNLELVKIEIEIMKICDHENIVRYINSYEDIENIYIIMEYLRGGNLNYFLATQGNLISESKAKNISQQVAFGVKYLHDLGIIHRDLKPDNIMISTESKLPIFKLMDFGLSKVLGYNEEVRDSYGTLVFSSPEIVKREPYDTRVDVWSLGVMIFYIITGNLPFDDDQNNLKRIVSNIINKEIFFYSGRWNTVSRDCIDLIKRCLEKSMANRCDIDSFINHCWLSDK